MIVTVLAVYSVTDPSQRVAVFIPLFWLAVTRLSNLLNDLTHGVNRTPKDPVFDEEDLTELEVLAQSTTNDEREDREPESPHS